MTIILTAVGVRKFASVADQEKQCRKAREMCSWCPERAFCTVEEYDKHNRDMHARCEVCEAYSASARGALRENSRQHLSGSNTWRKYILCATAF
jgi:hypothetical protein